MLLLKVAGEQLLHISQSQSGQPLLNGHGFVNFAVFNCLHLEILVLLISPIGLHNLENLPDFHRVDLTAADVHNVGVFV